MSEQTYQRAKQTLFQAGYSLEDVPHLKDTDLIRIPNMGRTGIKVLREAHPAKAEVSVSTHADLEALAAIIYRLGGKITYK